MCKRCFHTDEVPLLRKKSIHADEFFVRKYIHTEEVLLLKSEFIYERGSIVGNCRNGLLLLERNGMQMYFLCRKAKTDGCISPDLYECNAPIKNLF